MSMDLKIFAILTCLRLLRLLRYEYDTKNLYD